MSHDDCRRCRAVTVVAVAWFMLLLLHCYCRRCRMVTVVVVALLLSSLWHCYQRACGQQACEGVASRARRAGALVLSVPLVDGMSFPAQGLHVTHGTNARHCYCRPCCMVTVVGVAYGYCRRYRMVTVVCIAWILSSLSRCYCRRCRTVTVVVVALLLLSLSRGSCCCCRTAIVVVGA